MRKRCRVSSLLLVAGTVVCLAQAASEIVYGDGRGRSPEVWRYAGPVTGQFATSGDGKWVEINPQGTFYYREVARDKNCIEIYDGSRNVTVRLCEQACFIRRPGTEGRFLFLYARTDVGVELPELDEELGLVPGR